jgi:hypothetical protein
LRFAGCQEGRLKYSQDLDIHELVPAVAFRDSSRRAFGEYVDFSYEVNGSALQLNAHGAIGFNNFGLDVRISKEYSWSTGNLSQKSGTYYVLSYDGQNATVLFYSQKWRYVVYERYDPNTCLFMDEVYQMYLTHIEFDSLGRIALKATDRLPPTAFDEAQPSQTNWYKGVDGRDGSGNLTRFIDILSNEPQLLDAGGKVSGILIGKILEFLGVPYASRARHMHGAFNFKVYSGIPNYVASVATDADKGNYYQLRIYRAQYQHIVGDYVFYPLRVAAEIVD